MVWAAELARHAPAVEHHRRDHHHSLRCGVHHQHIHTCKLQCQHLQTDQNHARVQAREQVLLSMSMCPVYACACVYVCVDVLCALAGLTAGNYASVCMYVCCIF